MKPIWIVSAEIEPQPGSAFGPDDSDVVHIGSAAFVNCYVPASSIEDAIRAARDAIASSGHVLLDLDRCIRFDEDEWNDDNDPEHEVRGAVDRAASETALIFGAFLLYPKSDSPE